MQKKKWFTISRYLNVSVKKFSDTKKVFKYQKNNQLLLFEYIYSNAVLNLYKTGVDCYLVKKVNNWFKFIRMVF